MYSPKIREELIPRIYRAAKEAEVPMTTWVNQAVELCLHDTAYEPKTERKEDTHEHSSDRTQ